ncbi:DUF4352 domain-containing protein [Frankia sp. AgB32]|uniref:DUF4352 domain-containing protein n=1 Tax=Frankia sp. AgB32 TaxID=631119 RepID=UPI00200E8DBC|nr:DUF4352 domain-containing protein [Frankia sp. AgB32]MCK9893189.1 DUF4352 domain-containing protein [Frankia sp. AgB32]
MATSPYPASYQQPRRRGPDRRQLAMIVAVVLAAIIGIAIAVILPIGHKDGPPASGAPGPTASAAPSATPSAPGYGVPVTDGDLRFVVSSMDCSHRQLGDGLLALGAKGRFCQARVAVTNIGNADHSLDNNAQILWDDHGVRHEANFLARLKLDENLWDTIDPGETKNGTLVFDVPLDAAPRLLELHSGSHTAGARISTR